MRPRSVIIAPLLLICLAALAEAQKTVALTIDQLRFCEAKSETMYCFLPTFGLQAFKTVGLPPVAIPGNLVLPGQNQVTTNLSSLAGAELSFLPVMSPASGIAFTFDPQLGVVVPSRESLGPILSDRAETIGRNRVFLGFAYQHFGFDSFDGRPLRESIGAGTLASITDLTVDQYTSYLGYGITSRLEVSALIPVKKVTFAADGLEVTAIDPTTFGVTLGLAPNVRREQTGVGDISFRIKGTVWKREHGGVALGLDLRTPTGDALNFLGAGAYGAKPFIAASASKSLGGIYLAPHLNVGFEFNGTSILGSPLVGQEGRLPRRLNYAVGTEVGLLKRLTLSAEFTGDRLFNAEKIVLPVEDNPFLVTVRSRSINLTNASIGAKVNPVGRLVLTGNLTWRVNNAGLRARLIPLVGASYTF